VSPILSIDHEIARHLKNEGIGGRRNKVESDYPFLVRSLGDAGGNELPDAAIGGDYLLVPSAVAEFLRHDESELGGFWRSVDEVQGFAQRIDADLRAVAPQFFRERDTLPKLIDWLRSDPWAGGTATRIDILCLLYIQERYAEILNTVASWRPDTASPIELQFARYITDRIGT